MSVRHVQSDETSPSSGYGNATVQPSSSMNQILGSSSSIDGDSILDIKLSKKRWLVLAAFSLFGISIALSEITSPILDLFLKLMDLSIENYLYLQPVFYNIMMIAALPTALLVDKFGIKSSMHISAGLFVVQGFMRALVFYPDLPYHNTIKLPFYIISNIIGFEMMTIFFLLPLKVSETWFSSSERTVAWAFMVSTLNVGNSLASFVYPRIVRQVEEFKILAYLNIACVLVTAFATFSLVRQSEPEQPPSERMAKAKVETPRSLRQSILQMLRHRDIVIHLLHLAIFESLSMGLIAIIQPVLKSIGYDVIFTGNLSSVTSLITIVVQVGLAYFVHGMKYPTFVCKLSSFFQSIFFVAFLLIIIIPQPSWLLISITVLFYIFRAWAAPNFTNMTAHLSCGTVSQATVIGFSMLQTVLISTVVNFTFTKLIVKKSEDNNDYGHSLIFLAVLTTINEFCYLIFFHGRQAVGLDEERQQYGSIEAVESS